MTDSYGDYRATLYTLARIYDVSTQFLRYRGLDLSPTPGLPRTYGEYVHELYGSRMPDRFLWLNYGVLASVVALLAALVWLVR